MLLRYFEYSQKLDFMISEKRIKRHTPQIFKLSFKGRIAEARYFHVPKEYERACSTSPSFFESPSHNVSNVISRVTAYLEPNCIGCRLLRQYIRPLESGTAV